MTQNNNCPYCQPVSVWGADPQLMEELLRKHNKSHTVVSGLVAQEPYATPAPVKSAKSSLDERLREILKNYISNDLTTIRQIKQCFADEGYITPEQVKQTQELVNQMANLAQDMAKLPVTVREIGSMTGQEWYDKFRKELDELPRYYEEQVEILKAARRASGIGDTE